MFGMRSTKMGNAQLAKAETAFNAAAAARDAGDFDKALSLTLLAAEHAETARAWGLVRQSLETAGDLLVAIEETDQAIQMYQKALQVARQPGLDLQTLLRLTPLLRQQGRWHDAHRAACQASALAERLHAPASLSLARHWLACLAYERENWSSAEAYFHGALTSSRHAGEPATATRAILLLDLGHAVAQQYRLTEAAAWLEQSVAVAEHLGEQQLMVDGRHSLAVVYALAGDFDRAAQLLAECLALQQSRGDSAGCAETLSELALLASHKALAASAPVGVSLAPSVRPLLSAATA